MTKAKFFEILLSVRVAFATRNATRIVKMERENGRVALIVRQDRAPNAFVSMHFADNDAIIDAAFEKYSRWLEEFYVRQNQRVSADHAEALEMNAEFDAARAPAVTAPRDSIEAMVQIINASKGTGRGYADQFPAYSVMRIEADVMHISRDVAKVLTFATPRMTARHGKLYTMFSLSGVGAYSAEYGRNEADQIARAKANGHELFFFTQHGSSITSHERAHEFFLEILPGQKIMFDGVLLEVLATSNNNLRLVEVE
ncbi:hypothetical protein CPT_Scapp_041 [Serratia phage Scapp]|uniref:Uncharacterized protein n=1 Tax=Serratia phage Scapp TaxID=2282409 RepID=A0A345L6R8_9CAUD|nr:hypothetical protein PP898_gp41 [Serratia phage Scapp]AXH50970.1 hypothetical protein CPT_Scapp_041 [Serratia phage Scapp]